jgi:hypothetical protein
MEEIKFSQNELWMEYFNNILNFETQYKVLRKTINSVQTTLQQTKYQD